MRMQIVMGSTSTRAVMVCLSNEQDSLLTLWTYLWRLKFKEMDKEEIRVRLLFLFVSVGQVGVSGQASAKDWRRANYLLRPSQSQ